MHSLPQVDAGTQLEFSFEAQPAPRRASPYEPLLSIREVCAAFNVKQHVVRRAIKIGAIPAYRFGNGRIRLRGSDVDAAIRASTRRCPK